MRPADVEKHALRSHTIRHADFRGLIPRPAFHRLTSGWHYDVTTIAVDRVHFPGL